MPHTIEECFGVTAIEEKEVKVKIPAHHLENLLEKGEVPPDMMITGLKHSFRSSWGFKGTVHLDEEKKIWWKWFEQDYRSRDREEIRKATQAEIDTMRLLQELEVLLVAQKIS